MSLTAARQYPSVVIDLVIIASAGEESTYAVNGVRMYASGRSKRPSAFVQHTCIYRRVDAGRACGIPIHRSRFMYIATQFAGATYAVMRLQSSLPQ